MPPTSDGSTIAPAGGGARTRAVALGCWLFACLLLLAAGGKTVYPTWFYESLTRRAGLSDAASRVVGPGVVGVEVLLAGLLLIPAMRGLALAALVAMTAAFLAYTGFVASGDDPRPCGCFGAASLSSLLGVPPERLPAWEIGRNAVLFALSVLLLVAHRRTTRRARTDHATA